MQLRVGELLSEIAQSADTHAQDFRNSSELYNVPQKRKQTDVQNYKNSCFRMQQYKFMSCRSGAWSDFEWTHAFIADYLIILKHIIPDFFNFNLPSEWQVKLIILPQKIKKNVAGMFIQYAYWFCNLYFYL